MKLEKTYVVGCLIQFYEMQMLPEYAESCIRMMSNVENKKNVRFHFCLDLQEQFEKSEIEFLKITEDFLHWVKIMQGSGLDVEFEIKSNIDAFYNIAKYRRDLNYNHCETYDYVLWGETDSLWPSQTLAIIERLQDKVEPKHIITFAYRVNWDSSWDIMRHPLFELSKFQDNDSWMLYDEASEKSYMSYQRMEEINDIAIDQVSVFELREPKADGSCLIISSELIKSGVNIPHALLHCGEDESFMRMAKLVMGANFRQYLIKNILRVHNRRHPRKRIGIKNESNPRGFCGTAKGDWWDILEKKSKYNLENLRNQTKFMKI